MVLQLTVLPDDILGPNDADYKGKLPKRMRFAAPDVAEAFIDMDDKAGGLVVTDFFRSASESLHAHETKTGTQPPGYSAHGFGIALDLDVDASLKRMGTTYVELLAFVSNDGFFCHRRDGQQGSESWHLNYLGDNATKYLALTSPTNHASWAGAAEAAIQDRYGSQFQLTPQMVQQNLAVLGLYHGDIDGVLGPVSRTGISAFQRAWNLTVDGTAGPITQRVLAYVSADRVFES